MKEIDEVRIHLDFPEHKIQVGAWFNNILRVHIVSFLSENHDCLAWSHKYMTEIDMEVAMHHLQVDLDHLPVK